MKDQLISGKRLRLRWFGVLAVSALLASEAFAQSDASSVNPSGYFPAASVNAPRTAVISVRGTRMNSRSSVSAGSQLATAPVYQAVGQNGAVPVVGPALNGTPYDGQIVFDNPEDARLFSRQPVGEVPSSGSAMIAAPLTVSPAPVSSVPASAGSVLDSSASVLGNSTLSGSNVMIYGANPAAGAPAAVSGAQPSGPAPFGGETVAGKGHLYPNDEYISDGGVGSKGVRVRQDWQVDGLRPTDTIVHFDTLDGQVKVSASNKVEIYAPKFRSVRQVLDAVYSDQVDQLVRIDACQKLASQDRNVGGMTSKQHVPVAQSASLTPGEEFVGRIGNVEVSNRRALMAFDNNYKAYENLLVIRTGEVDRSEMAMTAESERRASVWEYTQNTQVVMSDQRVMAAVKDQGPGVLYSFEKDTDNPQVRIVKIASVDSAQPGDRVEFTIRFDNTGDEAVGNVTIIDSLSGRLEYAEGTAQCSKAGNFSVEPNEVDSLVLRWEITDPLEPGEGGIIRFECSVR